MRACKMKFKQPQDGARLGSKPTLKSKKNKTKKKHRRGRHLQKKKNLASMGNKASKRVSILNMFQEVA
jgi:hypothetical protein